MATSYFFLPLLFTLLFFLRSHSAIQPTSTYLSPSTFFPNHRTMLRNFKIFIYEREMEAKPSNPREEESLFHESLLRSRFLTRDPNEAHLFFIPLLPDASAAGSRKSVSRLIGDLRSEFPYWNRTLGADHFYVSCSEMGLGSDRNLVELRKNAIRISCFPAPEGQFIIPHKDISLPPVSPFSSNPNNSPSPNDYPNPNNKTERKLCYYYYHGKDGKSERSEPTLIVDLRKDPEFVIEKSPDELSVAPRRLSSSRFCLFFYGGGDLSWIGEALRFGCVPVVVSDRPIRDLPFTDVLRWTEIAVFVGGGVTAAELRHVLGRTCGEGYERMRGLGVVASRHFSWKEEEEKPYDSFHTGLYQLWLRRHTIRYARIEPS